MSISLTYNADCLAAMREMPDNAFDLAVVDPPYGGGFTESGGCKGWFTKYNQRAQEEAPEQYNRFGNAYSRFARYKTDEKKKNIEWDVAPEREYFDQLFRISRNQIIWGGNYFWLPPTRCFLVWRKLTISESFTMAMAEYAWTSFRQNAKVFEFPPQGRAGEPRFHPTQKPVELYAWIYKNFAEKGQKIIDTHLGSGSSRIAAWDAGLDFVGYEIDPGYFEKEEARFAKHTAQLNLFHMEEQQPELEQMKLLYTINRNAPETRGNGP